MQCTHVIELFYLFVVWNFRMRNRDHQLGQYKLFWFLLVLLLSLVGFANFAHAEDDETVPPVLHLDGSNVIRGDSVRGLAWIDPTGKATLTEITAKNTAKRFIPWYIGKVDAIPEQGALWLWFRVQRTQTSVQRWTLELPVTYIDHVNFYTESKKNSWQTRSAGDLLAVSDWSEPGCHPHIYIDLLPDTPTDVYIQVQHAYPLYLQIQMQPYSSYEQSQQLDFLWLGAVIGGLLLFITYSVLQSYMKREWVYFWFAIYTLTAMLAFASFTGLAGEYLWPDVPKQPGVYTRVFTTLVMGSVILLVREMFTSYRGSDSLRFHTLVFALLYVPLAVIHLWIHSYVGAWIHGFFIVAGFVVIARLSIRAILRFDKMGYWILASFSPVILSSITFTVARLLGYFPSVWATQSVMIPLICLQMPMLILVIDRRTHALYLNEFRARIASHYDALTNFFNPVHFQEALANAIYEQRPNSKNVAIVIVSLANYSQIQNQHELGVTEHVLVRCANKMRRTFGAAAIMGRTQDARLAVIMTNAISRAAVLEYLVSMIAWGLKPQAGFDNEITIQLHIAVGFLHEQSMQAATLTDALHELLSNMSLRTNRPIRFLEPHAHLQLNKVSESMLSTLD
jgi:GGDEF domain-containing protein